MIITVTRQCIVVLFVLLIIALSAEDFHKTLVRVTNDLEGGLDLLCTVSQVMMIQVSIYSIFILIFSSGFGLISGELQSSDVACIGKGRSCNGLIFTGTEVIMLINAKMILVQSISMVCMIFVIRGISLWVFNLIFFFMINVLKYL